MLGKFSRLLVVDDSVSMRKIVRGMLATLGHDNVHEAEDGRTALYLLERYRFELVISDWYMEPMNGVELMTAMRNARPSAATPFIMMTTNAVKFAGVARAQGCFHYLSKPFNTEQLAAKMLHAITGVAA